MKEMVPIWDTLETGSANARKARRYFIFGGLACIGLLLGTGVVLFVKHKHNRPEIPYPPLKAVRIHK